MPQYDSRRTAFDLTHAEEMRRIRIALHGIDYYDAHRITAMHHTSFGTLIVHRDIPPGEVHILQQERCVGKIVKIPVS